MPIKIVTISDTHNAHEKIEMPHGDILIHAGDMSSRGTISEIKTFGEWFRNIKGFKHKIIIAGNHDFAFQNEPIEAKIALLSETPELFNIHYLEDNLLELTLEGRALRIYGSPWQPYFKNYAFNLFPIDLEKEWSKIPDNLDILITHGPPQGILDRDERYAYRGCDILLKKVLMAAPKFHLFGHIHSGYGVLKGEKSTFINAALCDDENQIVNRPISIDI